MAIYYGYGYYSGPTGPLQEPEGPAEIVTAFVNGLGYIEVTLNKSVVINEAYLNPDNYEVVLTSPTGTTRVKGIRVTELVTFTNRIQIEIEHTVRGGTYLVTLNGALRTLDGSVAAEPQSIELIATQSKYGSIVGKLPSNYKVGLEFGNDLGNLMGALAISDFEIGGGAAVVP
jgi:hypothetical protein